MDVKQFVPPVLTTVGRKISKRRGHYTIGKYRITIPPNYALPNYQKDVRLYDRFLPVLAEKLPADKTIVDVGANIGDTAIAMLQHCGNHIICVEPSDVFFPYLEENVMSLRHEDSRRVKTIKKFIGTGSLSGELSHTEGGTAKITISANDGKSMHVPLDKIVGDSSNIILIKVDTDGFDFDVIESAPEILSASEPILLWEKGISEDFESEGFHGRCSMLEKKGYGHIYIFDNLGNLMAEESDFGTLRGFNRYLYSMEKHDCTRTLYYTDVLAATDRHHSIVKSAIDEYKVEWIMKGRRAND